MMQTASSWLTKLKAVQLHKIAVQIGTPCSGTKAALIQGIQDALATLPRNASDIPSRNGRAPGEISLVSIDPGIRNLAYAHWTAKLMEPTKGEPAQYGSLTFKAWRKPHISMAPSSNTSLRGVRSKAKTLAEKAALKETFEPIDYADHAYRIVQDILKEHAPTNVLIERQRFRSGGYAAVQEWTIRVGVFEGMLYAVLKSLGSVNAQHDPVVVEPMLPVRVNKYWLGGKVEKETDLEETAPVKKSAREVKKLKIDLVCSLLEGASRGSNGRSFHIHPDVKRQAELFVEHRNSLRKRPSSFLEAFKQDDFADSFLQGLAWLRWQNNRLRLQASGQDAYQALS